MNIVLHFNCNLLELTLFREHLIYSHFFSRSAGRTPRDLKSSKPKPLATFKLLIILYLSLKRTKTSVKDIFFVNYAKEICKKTIVLLQSQQGFLFIFTKPNIKACLFTVYPNPARLAGGSRWLTFSLIGWDSTPNSKTFELKH